MKQDKQITLEFHNVGPHADLKLVFESGVNVITGRNGIGKSAALAAASAALGAAGEVSVRDGEVAGTVTVDGHVALHIGKKLTKNGAPSIEIGAVSPLHDVIQPDIKDLERRDAATIRAILAMAPVPVTPEVIETLTSGDEELKSVPLPPDAPNNVLAVAEHFRKAAHAKALEKEKQSEQANGVANLCSLRLNDLPLPAAGAPPPLSIEDAESAVRKTTERATQVELLAKQRMEAEERHARISATLGEMPDASDHGPAAMKLKQTMESRYAAAKAVTDLKTALAAAESDLKGMLAQEESAKIAWEEVCKAEKQWREHTHALQEPITGPGQEEVVSAKAEAENAITVAKTAHAAAARRKVEDEMKTALMAHEAARERGKELRDLAHGVGEALGKVLAENGLDGFDVEDKRLFYKMDGKRMLFSERLSFGQRCKVALGIALKAYKGRFVPLDPAFWAGLQPRSQKEIADLAREMNVVLVSEAASDEDTISVVRM